MKVFFARIELSKQTLVVDFFELQSFFLLSLSSAHISVVNWGKTQNVVWRISKKLGIPSGRPQRHLLHNRLLRLLGARQEGSTPHSTLRWHRLSQLSGLFRRAEQSAKYPSFVCKYSGNCDITVKNRRRCQKCRYERCLKTGIKLSNYFLYWLFEKARQFSKRKIIFYNFKNV